MILPNPISSKITLIRPSTPHFYTQNSFLNKFIKTELPYELHASVRIDENTFKTFTTYKRYDGLTNYIFILKKNKFFAIDTSNQICFEFKNNMTELFRLICLNS